MPFSEFLKEKDGEIDTYNYPEEAMKMAWDAALVEADKVVLDQQKTIDNMAMLVRMLISERDINRKAKKFLIDNNLIGSPLRGA